MYSIYIYISYLIVFAQYINGGSMLSN